MQDRGRRGILRLPRPSSRRNPYSDWIWPAIPAFWWPKAAYHPGSSFGEKPGSASFRRIYQCNGWYVPVFCTPAFYSTISHTSHTPRVAWFWKATPCSVYTQRRIGTNEIFHAGTSEAIVLENLKRSSAATGRTTIIIAHRLATVRDADRIIVMRDGTIEQDGRHETLVKQQDGTYAELIRAQQFEKGHPSAASSIRSNVRCSHKEDARAPNGASLAIFYERFH